MFQRTARYPAKCNISREALDIHKYIVDGYFNLSIYIGTTLAESGLSSRGTLQASHANMSSEKHGKIVKYLTMLNFIRMITRLLLKIHETCFCRYTIVSYLNGEPKISKRGFPAGKQLQSVGRPSQLRQFRSLTL